MRLSTLKFQPRSTDSFSTKSRCQVTEKDMLQKGQKIRLNYRGVQFHLNKLKQRRCDPEWGLRLEGSDGLPETGHTRSSSGMGTGVCPTRCG